MLYGGIVMEAIYVHGLVQTADSWNATFSHLSAEVNLDTPKQLADVLSAF